MAPKRRRAAKKAPKRRRSKRRAAKKKSTKRKRSKRKRSKKRSSKRLSAGGKKKRRGRGFMAIIMMYYPEGIGDVVGEIEWRAPAHFSRD